MILYLSKTNDKLNTKELNQELFHDYLCLNPKYTSVSIKNPDTKILMDSGAFQDTEDNKRLTFEEALNRQLKLENKIGFISQKIVAYDYISNVKETLEANRFLASKREELKPRQLVLMIQGNSTREYVNCLLETLFISKPEDCIGFGGVAPAGKNNEIKTKLLDTIKICLPTIYGSGIRDIHMFGVGSFKVLKEVREILDIYKSMGIKDHIEISCDTSAFEIRSTMGSTINLKTEKWEKTYTKKDKFINYHPADLTIENMKKGIEIIGDI